jgi:hypothetical protein
MTKLYIEGRKGYTVKTYIYHFHIPYSIQRYNAIHAPHIVICAPHIVDTCTHGSVGIAAVIQYLTYNYGAV